MTPSTPPPISPSLTPIKPPQSPQSATSSTHSLQTNFVRSSKSTDSLDTDCGNNHSIDDSSQRSTPRLFQSFQWSNVFNGKNSKSTSQLNLVNCDKMHTVSIANPNFDASSTLPHDQPSKGLNYSASNFVHQKLTSPHKSLRFRFILHIFTSIHFYKLLKQPTNMHSSYQLII